jgi:putative ABC transport system ATP-binding protein
MEKNMTVALETRSLTKIYQTGETIIRAVDNVSLSINYGEYVALVGPSGSGKTTMLALLAGLLRPDEGEILIDGQDMSKMGEGRRTKFRGEKIGFVFQASNLLPYLTAQENIDLMLKLTGQLTRENRVQGRKLLTRLGLGDRLKNLPSQLSGGQQQRVAIARALVHKPAVVLADEPTASLDTERAYQVVRTFANLVHEQNRAGIMVTHDLRMCKYVDRMIQMVDGKIAAIITDKAEILRLAGESEAELAAAA